MTLRRPIAVGAAVFVAAVTGAYGVEAQESSDRGIVLHEYFDPGSVALGAGGGVRPGAAAPSETAATADKPPGLTISPRGGDRVLGPEGPVGTGAEGAPYGPTSPRSGFTQLDAKTDRVDDLDYFASFEPSVFPYKRNVAQNRAVRTADGAYRMTLDRGGLDRVHVTGGEAAPDEDTFWGSFLVRARPSGTHPIPSVAPSQRLLEVQTEPEVDVRFFRDRADNLYAEIDHRGLIRINAKVAAPRFYFVGEFSEQVPWSAVDGGPTPDLDADIEPVASRVRATIGVSREMAPAKAVRRLVYYFRDFEAEQLPESKSGSDLYERIAAEQIGVCRHRSLAFVVTAQSLGIPARYVTNEAHAFVEIRWPTEGWRRIDLGGAAREISYNGDRDDRLHDGASRDTLPKPPAYRRELREMRQQSGSSERPETTAGSPEGARDSNSERSGRRSSDGPGADSTDPGRSERRRIRDSDRTQDGSSGESRREAMGTRESADRTASGDEESAERKEPTRLTLRTGARTVFRGGTMTVRGRLTSNSSGAVDGRVVNVYFGPVGVSPAEMRKLGSATTERNGRYRLEVTIPETTGIGRWALVAVFAGDEQFESARAE